MALSIEPASTEDALSLAKLRIGRQTQEEELEAGQPPLRGAVVDHDPQTQDAVDSIPQIPLLNLLLLLLEGVLEVPSLEPPGFGECRR